MLKNQLFFSANLAFFLQVIHEYLDFGELTVGKILQKPGCVYPPSQPGRMGSYTFPMHDEAKC